MQDKPQVINYSKRVISPVLFGGKEVANTEKYDLSIPAMLADELFYMDCAVWVMYANYYFIVMSWNAATLGVMLPMIAFEQQVHGDKINANFSY